MRNNQRKHPRFPTSLETIYFTEAKSGNINERMYYPGKITNKSKGGVGMMVNYPHKIQDELWLEGMGWTNVPIPGQIRWVNEADENEEFLVGIEFAMQD